MYIGSEDHHVYALSANTGTVIWDYDAGGEIQTKPEVVDGMVFVGNRTSPSDFDNGHVIALDAASGNLVWKYRVEDWVPGSPAVANGIVHAPDGFGYTYALDAATGDLVWRYNSGGSDSELIVANDAVFIGSGSGILHALRAGIP